VPGENFIELVELMRRLRAPGGCPWDREQTFQTIKPYMLEEAYEVAEAIDDANFPHLREELGDLLLQVVFFSQMANEAGHFTIEDVVQAISDKLIRRHPHVFGEDRLNTGDEVKRKWADLKEEEKKQAAAAEGKAYQPKKSVLDGVSKGAPSLLEAYQLTDRAAFVGFDWPNVEGIIEKLEEEIAELRKARAAGGEGVPEEVGDLLFTVVNLARGLGLEPESTLRRSNRKFRTRFQWIEARLAEQNRKPAEASLEEMEELWQQAKLQMPQMKKAG
jgi:MazG family protein